MDGSTRAGIGQWHEYDHVASKTNTHGNSALKLLRIAQCIICAYWPMTIYVLLSYSLCCGQNPSVNESLPCDLLYLPVQTVPMSGIPLLSQYLSVSDALINAGLAASFSNGTVLVCTVFYAFLLPFFYY